MTSLRLFHTFLALLFTLGLGACEQGSTTNDTGTAAVDTGGTVETDTGTPAIDAPLAVDAHSVNDAPVTPGEDAFNAGDGSVGVDAPEPGETDAAVVESDAGFRGDAGSIGAGECNLTVECPPTCFRAITCVKECGGPETACGCCPCAAGSMDAIGCSAAD